MSAITVTWDVEVTETYSKTVEEADLPPEVMLFIENGWDLSILLPNTVYPEDAPYTYEQMIAAIDALDDVMVEHEEGPNNDVVTDRSLTGVVRRG